MRRRTRAVVLLVASVLASCGTTPGRTAQPSPAHGSSFVPSVAVAPSPESAGPSPSAAQPAATGPQLRISATGWRSNHGLWSFATVWVRFTNVGSAAGRVPGGFFDPPASYKVLDKRGVILATGLFPAPVPAVINPGQSTYAVSLVYADIKGVAKLEVSVPSIVAMTGTPPQFKVSGLTIHRKTGAITAVVQNLSASYSQGYCVSVVVLDSGGRPLEDRCVLGQVPIGPGERGKFTATIAPLAARSKVMVAAWPTVWSDQP